MIELVMMRMLINGQSWDFAGSKVEVCIFFIIYHLFIIDYWWFARMYYDLIWFDLIGDDEDID